MTLDTFLKGLYAIYALGKIIDGSLHNSGGCKIRVDRIGNITLDVQSYWKRIKSISLTRTRRKIRDERATANEVLQFRIFVGTLLYRGNGALPQASVAVSLMQRQVSRLQVSNFFFGKSNACGTQET